MDDATFVARFEDGTLPEAEFDHRGHVRLAYLYLGTYGFGGTLDRISSGIRAFATAHGAPEKYHETITVAFVSIVNERRAKHTPPLPWNAFVERNPELLDSRLLSHYYARETLKSEQARRTFVLPGYSEVPAAS